jgi:uncharacterized protein YkwD
MRRVSLLGLVALAWAVHAPALWAQDAHGDDVETIEAPAVPDKTPAPDLAAVSASIVERTNAFRKAEGRTPVPVSEKLKKTAESFADYMARTDRYGHSADGGRPADRAKKHGYDYCIVLENIAYAYNSRGFSADELAGQFTTGWKESPGHRRNMLDPDVTETAVAVARSAKTGYYYAVQLFGRPESAAVEFKVENRAGQEIEYAVGGKSFSLPARYTRTHTVCRPPEVTFRWPGEKAKGPSVRPTAGQKLVVTRDGGTWSVGKH